MNLLGQEASKAEELRNFILTHGDGKTRFLATVFYGLASKLHMDGPEQDVYQAMLIRFYSNSTFNKHVSETYTLMLATPLTLRYHTTCALLDCRITAPIDRYSFGCLDVLTVESLLDRMSRLEGGNMHPLRTKFVSQYGDAAKWLKCLIKRNVDAFCLEAVWRAIGSMGNRRSITQHSCSAPLAVLKNLVGESNIYIADAEEMLSELDGFEISCPKYLDGTI